MSKDSSQHDLPKTVIITSDQADWAIGIMASAIVQNHDRGGNQEIKLLHLTSDFIRCHPLIAYSKLQHADLIHWFDAYNFYTFCTSRLARKSISTVHHWEDSNKRLLKLRRARWLSALVGNIAGIGIKTLPLVVDFFLPTGYSRFPIIRAISSLDPRSDSEDFNSGREIIRIGMVANAYEKRKCARVFLAACSSLAARYSIQVVVAGRGWKRLLAEFPSLNIEIIPEGSDRQALAAFYISLDLYVCTSTLEGGPLPVVEALSFGVPIVSTDVGQVRNWVNAIDSNSKILSSASAEVFEEAISATISEGLARASAHGHADYEWSHLYSIYVDRYLLCLDHSPANPAPSTTGRYLDFVSFFTRVIISWNQYIKVCASSSVRGWIAKVKIFVW